MVYVAISILIIAIVISARLFFVKKEVSKIIQQLQNYTQRKTNKKIDVALIDKDVEKLAQEINELIDLYVLENRKRIQFESEHKQAIANMSHDLRTPLTSILGYLQMAEKSDLSEAERKELLSIAYKRAKRLDVLLNEFFELSVIESADDLLNMERISLKNVITEVLISFYDRFQQKKLEPTIHLPETDGFILADEEAVTRILENLFSNAVAHSDGNLSITFQEEHAKVKLIVSNDAFALTEQDVALMFDRFYMADQSRTGKSTGLGLSIAKSFMEKMNGTISAQYHDGQLSIICEWKALE